MHFEWDENKNKLNIQKHDVSFDTAQYAFWDKHRVIELDISHRTKEKRYFCYGKVEDAIVTVRFTIRGDKIRIFGAGYWRQGVKKYEKNQL